MENNPFVSIDSIVKGFSRAYGLEFKMLELRLKKEWNQIAGLPLARHTAPHSIKFRTLTVLAENSAWLQQLVFLKPVLLEKIGAFTKTPLISDIILRVAEKPCFMQSPKSELPRHSGPTEPDTESLAFAQTATVGLKDPTLQDSFSRLIAKALCTEKHSV